MERRNALKTIACSVTGLAVTGKLSASILEAEVATALKGNINHSVCQWTYSFLSLEELCAVVKKTGFAAIDLIGPKGWPTLKKNGIYSSMCNGAEINLVKGWNDKQYHPTLIKNYTEHIELVEGAGYKNLICFSGNRNGMDDETGMKNCAEGLKQIISLAEKKGVIIQMELFNSKVDHKDYMCDKTAWGIELCKRIGSPNFKLLYDIYHMQINEGDVIRTIKDNYQYFGHFHTAGVPGRNEIDETQELFYPAIMKAIAATGYKGYVAQEFIPTGKETKDKIAALKKAVKICDI
ncbi:MAG: TIM barrel protein [Chitinophagaceae bacterium]|nr:TIM barrel protein [Chitinophagaceae bacterium]MBK9570101.1 TIM barrel protein [Chitinophagaceae bacterium]MBL0129878.1 TIM barrel protein [Chitinophagaceae bacterium]MBL0273405.1 TIM barrel protein [Chitinophagaceae bacterium]